MEETSFHVGAPRGGVGGSRGQEGEEDYKLIC